MSPLFSLKLCQTVIDQQQIGICCVSEGAIKHRSTGCPKLKYTSSKLANLGNCNITMKFTEQTYRQGAYLEGGRMGRPPPIAHHPRYFCSI